MMARLYEVIARQLPKTATFWLQLKAEEFQHAGMLTELVREVQLGHAWIAAERENTRKITTSLGVIEAQATRWTKEGVSVRDAFRYALLMENSLVEKEYFVPLQGDSATVIQTLGAIYASTNNHIKRLREAAARYCRRPWYQRLLDIFDDEADDNADFWLTPF